MVQYLFSKWRTSKETGNLNNENASFGQGRTIWHLYNLEKAHLFSHGAFLSHDGSLLGGIQQAIHPGSLLPSSFLQRLISQ